MKTHGNLDLLGNFLENITLSPEANFPTNPKVGSFIFKDQRVMICIEINNGVPVWIPLTQQMDTHIHEQGVESTTWTIDHSLNTSVVITQIIQDDGSHFIPDDISSTFNQTVVTFAIPVKGKAILMIGDEYGSPRPNYAYEQTFTNSTSITVSHGLGYSPLLRVFVNGFEVQPASITNNDTNTATVTFSSAKSGIVRAI